jgi:hypothetical protein
MLEPQVCMGLPAFRIQKDCLPLTCNRFVMPTRLGQTLTKVGPDESIFRLRLAGPPQRIHGLFEPA